ncbi:MbtH family protein [Saccharopolyspora indica]|uniref:MbtH family protein n=1 Tax=Saccharopolyspora indica TaxID=1229659 RepID=UPI0022EA82D6|nr:MbtH family protein [Saccharopolyspora indica]MDA3647008.1 MbtH family protein [Saccharopolyspora indica]
MANPFDDPDVSFRVLRNDVGQHCLWPDFADVPGGWEAVHGPAGRAECTAYVTEHWTDLRPRGGARAATR